MMSLVLLGLGYSTPGYAAEPDVAGLQREVSALSALVQRLQARVDRLEAQTSSAAGPPAFAAANAAPASAPREAARAPASAASQAEAGVVAIAARRVEVDPIGPGALVQLKRNWAKLAAGMTSAEVSGLLGEPTGRLKLDGRNVWYYSYPALGNGSVFFTDAGIVSSRQSPFPWGG